MSDKVKEAPFLRTPYNYDMELASDESSLFCRDPSLTDQSFQEEADLNFLLRKFGLGMQMPENFSMPEFADFREFTYDYQSAMNMVIDADKSFMTLPADVRRRFGNDPQMLLEFLADEGNRDEAEKLGLLKEKPKPAEPVLVKMADPPAQ